MHFPMRFYKYLIGNDYPHVPDNEAAGVGLTHESCRTQSSNRK